MKILIISDTHKHLKHAIHVIDRVKPDRVMHLGDHASDAQDLQAIYPDIPFDFVAGNCDYVDASSPAEKIVDIWGKRFFLSHGHNYHVKSGTEFIAQKGTANFADVVLFGHTHKQHLHFEGEMVVMNPGSISSPRGSDHPGFGVIEIDEKARIHATLKELKK